MDLQELGSTIILHHSVQTVPAAITNATKGSEQKVSIFLPCPAEGSEPEFLW